MLGVHGEIRFLEESIRHGQTRLAVAVAVLLIASGRKIIPQPNQALRRNGRSGTVHGLPAVERVGWLREVSTQTVQLGRTSVPHRDAVRAGIGEIEVRCRAGSLEEQGASSPLVAGRSEEHT